MFCDRTSRIYCLFCALHVFSRFSPVMRKWMCSANLFSHGHYKYKSLHESSGVSRALFHVGAWCSNPSTHVLSYGFVPGFGHSRSIFCLVCACDLEFARPCALLSTCLLFCAFLVILCCCAQFVFLSAAIFSLAACFCPVLHMAGDLFFWPCACVLVLCEHMAFVFVFCVPCALISIELFLILFTPLCWQARTAGSEYIINGALYNEYVI